MNKQCKVATVLVVAVVFCFASASMVEAKGPIWQIFKAGTNQSIKWKTHKPNPRFAKWKAGTPDTSDDMVLDRETGLVWERVPPDDSMYWDEACNHCRDVAKGNRKGWRLPTYDELATLIDPSKTNPVLPAGNPFLDVLKVNPTYYWTQNTYETDTSRAYIISMEEGLRAWPPKLTFKHHAWCVRGDVGYDAY